MRHRTRPRRWGVASQIPVVVLLIGALTLACGWHSLAPDAVRHAVIDRPEAAAPLGLSGDPATGMAFAR